MTRCARVVATLVCVCASAYASARANALQGPPPGTAPGRAWTDQMVAESLVVLRRLDSIVTKSPRDAAAWYRRAMISWGLMYRDKIGPPYKGVDWTLLLRKADTSMRIAQRLDPNNPRMSLALGQLFLGTGTIAMRVGAQNAFTRALRQARALGDSAFLAEALVEQGRVMWRRYDALANRRIANDGSGVARSLQTFIAAQDSGLVTFNRGEIIANLNSVTQPLGNEFSGETEYARAEELFREAYAVAPGDPRAFRQLAMLIAERRRWNELAGIARQQRTRAPNDPQGLLALGLALQRTRRGEAAEAAFDSALTMLSSTERAHIMSLQRVLSPNAVSGFESLDSAQRTVEVRRYWLANDPLWSRQDNQPRTEFLARAVYADLRWTVEELGVRGIDSDRGEFHVRYGQPDLEAQLGPAPSRADMGGTTDEEGTGFMGRPAPFNGFTQSDDIMNMSNVSTIWAYRNGVMIVFRSAPTYATARLAPNDQALVDSIVRRTPADFTRPDDERIVDMPTQVSRFRATRDSVDVYVATEAPIAAMREATGANATVRLDFWLFESRGLIGYRDSVSVREPGPRAWLYRVGASEYTTRIEATSDASMLAGRTANEIDARDTGPTAFARTGFGISDLLLASSVEAPRIPRRWDDLAIHAIGGTVASKSSVVMLWENYDFGNDNGTTKYEIKLTIRYRSPNTIDRIRASIVAAMAVTLGREEFEGRVIHRFERQMAHAPITVDQLTVNLNESNPGEYFLTLEITDRVSGQVATRERRIVITK
ncbi:MAG TPA: GWxTD domain-containing protein [Gemmatimonadaceae bacterium]|nr:GWxTD domain-containing protein [Gemmatimonadaceae bacterium]